MEWKEYETSRISHADRIGRRLGSVSAGEGPAFASAPSRSANEKVRFACIGVGGKGDSDTNDAGDHGEIVGLCDIDAHTLDKKGAKYPTSQEIL